MKKPILITCALAIASQAGIAQARPAHRHPNADEGDAAAVAAANRAALLQPSPAGYLNAIQVYPYMDGSIYRLFAAPDRVSDIALQPGEQLVAISSGDTARWVIGDTSSGSGSGKQVHILVKPFSAGLKTNLVVTTNLRTYHIEMVSTPETAMTAISWSYPQDAIIAAKIAQEKVVDEKPVASGLTPADLFFGYDISGDKPDWRPVRVFDDGTKVYIQFPLTMAQSDAPPIFVIGDTGKAELVNYRVAGNYYVVDRLFSAAELRLGEKHQVVVKITRQTLVPPKRTPPQFAGSARGGEHG